MAFGLALLSVLPTRAAEPQAAVCDFYASPSGVGTGLKPTSAFQIADFWRHAGPGKTLCLMDGRYQGPTAMIAPTKGVSGQPGSPITVRALTDGKVLIDGEAKRLPIRLSRNDWVVIEGVNACCSNGTVVGLDDSSHDIVRRVAAWDAADRNDFIFGIHYGDHNLLEDVAGWGTARKVFSASQGGDFTTIRRAWGRWEGSHVIGPKLVFSLAYNNYNMLIENSIGTWSGERMKDSYTLLDYEGKPWSGRGQGVYADHKVNQPMAIFGVDGLTNDKRSKSRLLGSIAYIAARDTFPAAHLIFVSKVDSLEIADTLASVEKGSHAAQTTFGLYGLDGSTGKSSAIGLTARNLASFGGSGPVIAQDWDVHGVITRTDRDAVSGNSFLDTPGAPDLCHRYVDGALTDQPLWPWPMNERIVDAMRQSGRPPVDVTATVEALVGPIPARCRAVPIDR